ncbi:HIT domain-containing protein [Candidatus Azambacteria bacterium]|nr:HIT domain-containing protein [Candidatus Azambacteria bacterium]
MASEKNKKDISEIRQDPVKGEWVIIATARGKRPHAFSGTPATIADQKKESCPFEDPFSEREPSLVFWNDKSKKDWSLVVIQNKFPALEPVKAEKIRKEGPYHIAKGVGFHELVIARDHDKFIPDLSKKDAEILVLAYNQRYREILKNRSVEYVFILHNHGRDAGASLRHLHSQIIAPSVVPTDVQRSIDASEKYFSKNKKCIHCKILKYELKDKKRVVYQNKKFAVFVPFASKMAFEINIFPKEHEDSFGDLKREDMKFFADALQKALQKLRVALNDPAFNFFIHSSPKSGNHKHYHWHMEIFPKTSVWAGYEIGTGMPISAVRPEDAAKFLRGAKVQG